LLDDFFEGTFAPFLRAFESPIAIACLRLLIGCFFECFPDFMWCISVRTSWLAFFEYLRPLDFFFELDFERLDFELDLRERDFVAIQFLPCK
jgi:hypothetical protein